MPGGVSPADHFGFDVEMMFIDASPRFPMRVLDRTDGFVTYEDRYGYTMRKDEDGESTIDFVSHRNTSRAIWESEIRPRLVLSDDPAEPSRLDDRQYFGHFDPYPSWTEAIEKHHKCRARGRYQLFMVYGPWEALWRMRGMENLLMDLIEEPDWIAEMIGTYVDLLTATLDRCHALGAVPDGIFLAEDLGCSSGPLFSPRTWDALFRPRLEAFGEFLRQRGIAFWMHSDGRIQPYIDRLIEIGVQVLNPLEVKAGMDSVELRARYGRNLAFYGGISAQAMASGRAELELELQRKVPLAREGGYILHSDHSVPPDVSYEQFSWMQRRAQEIFEDASITHPTT